MRRRRSFLRRRGGYGRRTSRRSFRSRRGSAGRLRIGHRM